MKQIELKYVSELRRMGANIAVEGNAAFITGVEGFTGATVSAPDLRAGAALVMAGLAAEGYTYVDQIQYLNADMRISQKRSAAWAVTWRKLMLRTRERFANLK